MGCSKKLDWISFWKPFLGFRLWIYKTSHHFCFACCKVRCWQLTNTEEQSALTTPQTSNLCRRLSCNMHSDPMRLVFISKVTEEEELKTDLVTQFTGAKTHVNPGFVLLPYLHRFCCLFCLCHHTALSFDLASANITRATYRRTSAKTLHALFIWIKPLFNSHFLHGLSGPLVTCTKIVLLFFCIEMILASNYVFIVVMSH